MADAATMRALTELLAGQVRAEERHEALIERFDQSDLIQRQVMQGIVGMTAAFGSLREAVDKLTEAANGEKPDKEGRDLGVALAAILKELKDQGDVLKRAAAGIEALPSLLAESGFATEDLAKSGNGSPPGVAS